MGFRWASGDRQGAHLYMDGSIAYVAYVMTVANAGFGCWDVMDVVWGVMDVVSDVVFLLRKLHVLS